MFGQDLLAAFGDGPVAILGPWAIARARQAGLRTLVITALVQVMVDGAMHLD